MRSGGGTEVQPAVVQAVAVFVVDLIFWPFACHDKVGEAVCFVEFGFSSLNISNFYLNILLAIRFINYITRRSPYTKNNIWMNVRMHSMREDARQWIIIQTGSHVLGG